jgi:hypothetical protein
MRLVAKNNFAAIAVVGIVLLANYDCWVCMYELFLAGLNKLTGQDKIDKLACQIEALSRVKKDKNTLEYQCEFDEIYAKLCQANRNHERFIWRAKLIAVIAAIAAVACCVETPFSEQPKDAENIPPKR